MQMIVEEEKQISMGMIKNFWKDIMINQQTTLLTSTTQSHFRSLVSVERRNLNDAYEWVVNSDDQCQFVIDSL